jgi:PKHD-type hydroxylase
MFETETETASTNFGPTTTYMVGENAFTAAEVDRLVAYGDSLDLQKAVLVGDTWRQEDADRIRITRNAWLTMNEDTEWVYERMQALLQGANEQFHKFELNGFTDDFQYTVYHGTEGGHYDWHMDLKTQKFPRKLSMSIQLSDPNDYEGCDLQFYGNRQLETAPRTRGTAIIFPSYVMHRVTPVISGTRKALVAWAGGPSFK